MREDWVVKNLGDVCDIIGGGTPSKKKGEYYDGDIPWATVRDMNFDNLDKTDHQITELGLENSSSNVIPKKNVIIATRVGLGKVCILKQDTAINQDLKGIIPKSENLLTDYLFLWFKSIADKIINAGTGATVQGVKIPFVKNLEIPIPPLPEQKRIVAILDEAFEALDWAKANIERNIENAEELFQSKLNGIFSQRGVGWEGKSLKEITKIINGYAFKSKDFASENPVKAIKITNVGVQEFVENSNNNLPAEFTDTYSKVQVSMGDIVIALTRTIISSGLKVARVPDSYDRALVNQRVAAISPNKNFINPTYLYYFLSTDIVSNYVLSNVNTLMQPNLSIKDLRRLKVPICDIQKQKEITYNIDSLWENIDELIEVYQTELNSLEELKKSILQQAFSGQLTGESGLAGLEDQQDEWTKRAAEPEKEYET